MKRILIFVLVCFYTGLSFAADTKTTALTENTTPAETDIIYIVDDPGGTPASQKITKANFQKDLSPTGDVDMTGANSVSIGPLDFTSGTAGSADGEFRYTSAPVGLTDKQMTVYTTRLLYLLGYDTLPTVDGAALRYNAANDDFDWKSDTTGFNYIINGGGSVLTVDEDLPAIQIPYDCTITKVILLADQTGSVVVDIWKDTYANYPPTVADTITAAAKPTISSAIKYEDATLTGWTTSVSKGDSLKFNVDSATTIEFLTIIFEVTK